MRKLNDSLLDITTNQGCEEVVVQLAVIDTPDGLLSILVQQERKLQSNGTSTASGRETSSDRAQSELMDRSFVSSYRPSSSCPAIATLRKLW